MRRFLLVAAALGTLASCSGEPAFAHRHHHRHHAAAHRVYDANGNFGDPRPAAWCGWFMRHVEHVADRTFNLARAWAHFGEPAGGPAPGVIVVWPHHVGKITRRGEGGEWVVLSGNDGHAVRERERSLRGAIAFRRASL